MTNKGANVLLIEDDESSVDMLKVLLSLSGHQVMSALTVADGLSLARGGGFDVVLLDNLLPDGNGHQACQQIRAFDALTPIIFCSGDASMDAKQSALAAGAQHYLVKPIDPDELKQLVAKFFNAEQTSSEEIC